MAARSSSLPAAASIGQIGSGLAPLPVIVGENELTLVRVLDLQTHISTPFYLLMHQDMRSTPRVRVLFDFVIEHLAEIRPLLTPEKRPLGGRLKSLRRLSSR